MIKVVVGPVEAEVERRGTRTPTLKSTIAPSTEHRMIAMVLQRAATMGPDEVTNSLTETMLVDTTLLLLRALMWLQSAARA